MTAPSLSGLIATLALVAACEAPSTTTTQTPAPPTSASVVTQLRGTIVFSTETDAGDDVFILHLGDPGPLRLTDDPADEFDPSLSPDGAQIAYRRNSRPDSDDADIWIMNIDGSSKRNLTRSPDSANWAPTWTPDGRIAFSSDRGNDSGALELWIMAADGSDERRVGAGWCEYAQPSPDGGGFVCAAAVNGAYDLVIVTAAGRRTPLTSTPVTEFGPSWSPDGQWIAFSRDAVEHWTLLRIRPDGTGEEAVAEEGVFPTWDPSGHLAWSGPGGINVAQPDGSEVVTIDYPASFISWGK